MSDHIGNLYSMILVLPALAQDLIDVARFALYMRGQEARVPPLTFLSSL